MPIIDCFRSHYTDDEINKFIKEKNILNKEVSDLTEEELQTLRGFIETRSDDILTNINTFRGKVGFDPIEFINQNQQNNENNEQRDTESGQSQGEPIQQRGVNDEGVETNNQEEADQGSPNAERPQQQEGDVNPPVEDVGTAQESSPESTITDPNDPLQEGFAFVRNGKQVEIAPPQEGDPVDAVRVRNVGSTGKGNLVTKSNLRNRLDNPNDSATVYESKDDTVSRAYDVIYGDVDAGVDLDVAYDKYKNQFISPNLSDTELRTAIEAKRETVLNDYNKTLKNDKPYANVTSDHWNKFVQFFKRKIRNPLRSAGHLGVDDELGIEDNSLMEHLEDKRGFVQSTMNRASTLGKKLDRLRKKLEPVDDALLDRIIKGASLDILSNKVPQELKNQIGIVTTEMRDIIDGLSRQLKTLGILDSPFLEIVKDNEGKYVTRIYMRDMDSNWDKKVPKRVWNNAKRIYRQELFKALKDGRVVDSKKDYVANILADDKLMDNFMTGILRKRTSDIFKAKGSIEGSKDTSILKKRKDIPQDIREFYGEITDAKLNFLGTTEKLVNFIGNTRLLDNLQREGWGKIMSDVRMEPDWVELNKSNTDTLTPFESPVFMHPDVYKQLELIKRDRSIMTQYALALNGMIKEGKTIFSPVTQNRNFISATFWMLANGVGDPRYFNNARKIIQAGRMVKGVDKKNAVNRAISKVLGEMPIEEANDLWNRMVNLQVADQNVVSREAKDAFYEAFSGTSLEEIVGKIGGGKLQKLVEDSKIYKDKNLGDVARGFRDKARQVYSDVDDFYRISYFLKERDLFAKALYKKNIEDLTVDQRNAVEREAARVVRNTYPNYSKIYPAVAKLREFPLLGPFVSFSAEMLRTTRNQIVQIGKEINSGNRDLQINGFKRLAGLSATSFMTVAGVELAAKMIFGFDEEQERDLVFHRPPWVETMLPLENIGNGKYSYFNPSTINPYGYFSDIMNSFRNADTSMEGAAAAIVKTLEPFFGPEISVDVTIQQLAKAMEKGNLDTTSEKMMEAIGKVIDGFAPGIVYSGKRIISPKVTKEDLEANPDIVSEKRLNEIRSLTGFRISEIDLPRSFILSVGPNIVNTKARAFRDFNRVFKYQDTPATEEEIKDQYNKSSEIYDEFLDDAREEASRLRRLGVEEDKLEELHMQVSFNNLYKLNADERNYILGVTDSKPKLIIEDYNKKKGGSKKRKRTRTRSR